MPSTSSALALSPSRLDTLNCPLRFHSLYVANPKVREPIAPELSLGSLVHQVAAEYVEYLRDNKRQTGQDALDAIADRVWADRSPIVPADMFHDFYGFSSRLIDWIPEPETIIGSEEKFGFTLDWKRTTFGAKDVAWRGILDVIGIRGTGDDAVVMIRDWTTGALGGAIEAKKDLQLRFYGLAAFKLYGIARAEVTMHSLRTGAEKTITLDREDHERTEKLLLSERNRLARMLDDPETEWDPAPGANCSICRLPCPAADDALAAGVPIRIETMDQAREVLANIVILDERRKRLTKPMKAWCSQRGGVDGNGLVAEITTSESATYDPAAVFRVLSGTDRSAFSVMKVDGRLLKKTIGKDGELEQAIAELATWKTKERFAIHRGGEKEEGGDEE